MKYNELNEEKAFTKKESNDIIRKDYNPLKVNYKIYKRGSGLFVKNETLKEIIKDLNWKGRILVYIFPNVFIKVYKRGIEKGFNAGL